MTEMNEEPMMDAAERAVDSIENTMDMFLSAGHVQAVYGDPIENGDTLVIPSAEILSIAGFGMGSGSGVSPNESESGGVNSGSGGGGGGGGRVLSRPVAIVISSPAGVRVEPIVDVTKLGLAALTAVGFMVATMLRMRRTFRVE